MARVNAALPGAGIWGIAAGGHARAPHHRHVRGDVPGHRRLIWRWGLWCSPASQGGAAMRVAYLDRRLSGGRGSPTRQAAVSEQSFRRKSGGFPAGPGLDTAAGHGHRVAGSASGQQGPAGRHERGRELLEQLLERGTAVGLAGDKRPVDGGEREPRELVSDRAPRSGPAACFCWGTRRTATRPPADWA
jgi:hypothetical protein